MAVHQKECYSINPIWSHELATMIIGRYLVYNPDHDVIYTIYKTKGINVCVDADFAGDWDSTNS